MSESIKNTNSFIRQAGIRDASRIAEILVFSKRMHYRRIFLDDAFTFGVLQVYPLVQEFLSDPNSLSAYAVYDDGFVKGLIHTEGDEIVELYVDPFFERQHIGAVLMDWALSNILHPLLWVLDGNDDAVAFYRKYGFEFTGERKFVPGTDKYESRMRHSRPVADVLGKTIRVTVDRPLGSHHPKYNDMIYPVNYGYVAGTAGGDGDWQDAYILGLSEPVSEFTGKIIAIIHREDDVEDKWVAAPEGLHFSKEEILHQVSFQERFFHVVVTQFLEDHSRENSLSVN